jgi:pimeloyl-ACP methyl ester carboxylesterase
LPFVALPRSPLAPEVSSVSVYFRDVGSRGAGAPIVLLHGGWGYEIYPYDRQIAALGASHRIVVPDRTGYGQSGRVTSLPIDFHQRAAEETLGLLDALALERPVLWGHSDGAVIALRLAAAAPDRVGGIIAEATHVFRDKPASRSFFQTMRDAPDDLGARVTAVLEREHGPRWRELIQAGGDAWLRIAAQGGDLYDGRLTEVRVPVLVIHGAKDPRTEPGELDSLKRGLTHADVTILHEGGHSPHSERATADEVTSIASQWLAGRN